MLPTIDANIIDHNETVSRYLLSSSDFATNKLRVKARALEPSPIDQSTSVFRVNGLTENEIWDMGTREVADPRGRRIHARADFTVSHVLNLNLSVIPSEPPERHALISGWSNEKHSRMAKAQELAAQASLKLP